MFAKNYFTVSYFPQVYFPPQTVAVAKSSVGVIASAKDHFLSSPTISDLYDTIALAGDLYSGSTTINTLYDVILTAETFKGDADIDL